MRIAELEAMSLRIGIEGISDKSEGVAGGEGVGDLLSAFRGLLAGLSWLWVQHGASQRVGFFGTPRQLAFR